MDAVSLFSTDTGWELGEPEGNRNSIENIGAVRGPLEGWDPVCMPATAPGPFGVPAHGGDRYEVVAGKDDSDRDNSFCYFNVFDADIFVESGFTLSYWAYHGLSPSGETANVSMDWRLSNGDYLRDFLGEDYLRDQNGVRIHSAFRQDATGEWLYVEIDLIPLQDEMIDCLMFAYDDPYPDFPDNPRGIFLSFVDDVRMTRVIDD